MAERQRAAAEAYIAANEESWRNPKHRQQWRNTLATYVYPAIGDTPVGEIDTAHVLQIVEPICKEKAETASCIRGRTETILNSAKAHGSREYKNPARWRGHLARSGPSRGRHRAMPYRKIPDFLRQLRQREAVAALALEFVILTAARSIWKALSGLSPPNG